MKLLGLISDTHIPSRRKTLPKAVLEAFSTVDLILHAGDFEELAIASILEDIAPLVAVHGNMCHSEVKQRFPSKTMINVEDLSIGLIHGGGSPSGYLQRVFNDFKLENLPDIIVCGHTHQPIVQELQSVQFINPGSPTDKYFASRNTIAILKIEGKEFDCQFIEIN